MTIAKSGASDSPDEPFGHFAPSALQSVIIALVRHTFLRRGDFRRHCVGLLNSLRPTPIDAGFRGGRYRLHYQDNLAECGLLLSPNYNSADIEFLLAGTPVGGVFLDVSANVGLYTIPLALKVGPSGRAVAVEPGDVALSRLRFNIAASGVGNIAVMPFAAGERDFRASLHLPAQDLALFRVVADAEGGVRVRPLVDILAEAGITRVDTMKVDVEGFEDRVVPPFFEKAPRSLWPKRICLEPSTLYGQAPIHDFLRNLGFVEVGRNKKNSLFQAKDTLTSPAWTR